MNPTRSVILAMVLAFSVFLISGKNGSEKLADTGQIVLGKRRTGTPTTSKGPDYGQVLGAWAFLFVAFIVLTDIDQTAEIATSFAWLFAISIALIDGPDMLANISKTFSTPSTPTSPSGPVGAPAATGQGSAVG